MQEHSLKAYLERQPSEYLEVILYNYLQYENEQKRKGLANIILEILEKRKLTKKQ